MMKGPDGQPELIFGRQFGNRRFMGPDGYRTHERISLMTLMGNRGMRNEALGLYISIPFCRSKCTYCNFASGVYPASEHARYVRRLIEDMANAGAWAAEMRVELPRVVDTFYLGGGTPSLLEPQLISQLCDATRGDF